MFLDFLGIDDILCARAGVMREFHRVRRCLTLRSSFMMLHDASCLLLAFAELTIPVFHSGCARLPCRCVRRGYSTFAGVNRPNSTFCVVARSSCQKKKCAKSSQLRLSNACDICSRFFVSFLFLSIFQFVLCPKRNILS